MLFQDVVKAFPTAMNSAKVGAPIGEGREQKDAIDEEVGILFKRIPFISIHCFISIRYIG